MILTITVNRRKIEVKDSMLTGETILELAGYEPDEYNLFQIRGQDARLISLDQKLNIKDAMYFNAVLKNVPYG